MNTILAVPFKLLQYATLIVVLLLQFFMGSAAGVTIDDIVCQEAGGTFGTCFSEKQVCGEADEAAETNSGGSVVIIGDSITEIAKDTYTKKFADPWSVIVDGLVSRQIKGGVKPDGMEALDNHAADIGNASAIVIALGTNSVSSAKSTNERYVQDFMKKLKEFNKAEAPVYWVNVLDGTNLTDSRRTNDAIKDGVGSDASIIDWYATAVADDGADYKNFDLGVHPKKQSDIELLANLVYEKVTETPSAGGGTSSGSGDDTSGSTTNLGKLPAKSQKVFDAAMKNINTMRPVYEKAAKRTGIPWEYLAALHYRESNNRPGTSVFAGEPLGATNPDGVGDTGGSDAVQNAVKAAEHFIGNAKGVYGVDVKKDTDFKSLQEAFIAYNRGYIYKRGNVNPDKSPYVMSGYDEDHALPMPWPVLPGASGYTELPGSDARLGAMAILAGLGISGNSSGDSSSGGCTSATVTDPNASGSGCDELGQLPDKFTFPLCTTKKKLSGHSPAWCYKSSTSCHHDYAAADIFTDEGTTVIVALGGTVYSADDPGSCSASSMNVPRVQIKGSDGKYYYYTHMKPGSLAVKAGQKVSEGDKIGVVGPTACAQGTPTHLHIHRGSGPTMCAGTASCSQHADYNRNSVQPDLKKAYEKLPEGG